ncbi:MAG: hypothetical protein KC900_02585 [Candidatus Omnitrophica bacterium]|nr:hypothetical protein [Candidatus Omnitrophota bacterium]
MSVTGGSFTPSCVSWRKPGKDNFIRGVGIMLVLLFLLPVTTYAGQPVSKSAAVISYTGDGGDVYELRWAFTEQVWNQQEIFITVHVSDRKYGPDHIARIYAREADGYRLLEEVSTQGNGYLLRPNFFPYETRGLAGRRDRLFLLQLTEKIYGTGSFTQEHIYRIGSEGGGLTLQPVDYVPAPESYRPYLAVGEAVWKGENNRFSGDGLDFEFFIWRERHDGNCCPSGGRVKGHYKIVPVAGREAVPAYRIEMDTFERLAYEQPD